MNVAGKSLQDIYDAGSKRLEELAKAQKSQLNDITATHMDERKDSEPQTLSELEARCNDLEGEIRAYLTSGLERAEKVVLAESEHTQAYIQRLVDGLALLAKKFNESIVQLQETAENQLNDLSSDNEQLLQSAGEATHSQINHEGVVAVDHCRNQGMQAHQTISTGIEESCNHLLEKEDEAVGSVLSTYDANAEQLQTRFADCHREIEEQLTDGLSKLELRSMQATEGIRSVVDQVVETADRFVFDSDVKLKERFSALLYEMSTTFDESAQRAQTNMVDLHQSSMADLSTRSQELKGEMDSLADNVTEACRHQSGRLQYRGNGLLTAYTDRLNQRLELSRVFQHDLKKERADMVSEIWRELSDVQTRFQERLSALSQSTLERMRTICDEAEKAIVTAQHSCIADSKAHAADKQSTIETSASQFVVRIQKTRDSALDGISKAAGAGTASDDTQENSSEDENEEGASEDATNQQGDSEQAESRSTAAGSGEKRRRRTSKGSDKRGEGKK